MASQAGGEATDQHVSVVILGHSYTSRLAKYMLSGDRKNFGLRNITVHFEGVGGATLRPKEHKCIWSFRQAVADHQPDIIFLHIGENDLGSLSPGDITREIMLLVNNLSTLNRHPVVILGQLISFPATQHQNLDSIREINASLRNHMPAGHVFWHHRFGLSPESGNFLRDNVHLNPHGMRRYYKSLRAAIGRVYHRNHTQP